MTPEALFAAAELLASNRRGQLCKRSSFASTDGEVVIVETRDRPDGAALGWIHPDGRELWYVVQDASWADLEQSLT